VAHHLRQPCDNDRSSWKTPWAAAGLPEPGWWKAFVVDSNLVLTRTPHCLGPKPNDKPREKEAHLKRPRPAPQPLPPNTPEPAVLPPIDRLPASPHSQPAVHSQIAKIRAEFAAGLEDAQISGKIPAAAEEKALSGSEEVAHVQELALTPDTAAEPHITKQHEPTAPWVSSLALTFVWQASSYRRDLMIFTKVV
jgi:hypothetical protein